MKDDSHTVRQLRNRVAQLEQLVSGLQRQIDRVVATGNARVNDVERQNAATKSELDALADKVRRMST